MLAGAIGASPTSLATRGRRASLGGAAEALALAVRAGDHAAAGGDHDDAITHYRRALDVVDLVSPPDEPTRLDVMIRLGESLVLGGRPEGREVLREVIRRARAIDRPETMAAAVCGMVAIGSTSPGRPDPEFTALAEEALAALGDVPGPIGLRLLALLAGHLRVGVDAARGYDLAGEALDEGTRRSANG